MDQRDKIYEDAAEIEREIEMINRCKIKFRSKEDRRKRKKDLIKALAEKYDKLYET